MWNNQILYTQTAAKRLADMAPGAYVYLGETSRSVARAQSDLRPEAYKNLVRSVLGPELAERVPRAYQLVPVRNSTPAHLQLIWQGGAGDIEPEDLRDRMLEKRLCYRIYFPLHSVLPNLEDNADTYVTMIRLFAPGTDEVAGVSFHVNMADAYRRDACRITVVGEDTLRDTSREPKRARRDEDAPRNDEDYVRAATLGGLSDAVYQRYGARSVWTTDLHLFAEDPNDAHSHPLTERVAYYVMSMIYEAHVDAFVLIGRSLMEQRSIEFGQARPNIQGTESAMIEMINSWIREVGVVGVPPLPNDAVLWYPTLAAGAEHIYGSHESCVVDIVYAYMETEEDDYVERIIPMHQAGA